MTAPKDVFMTYMITEGPSTLQNRFEYNADSTVLYAGYAVKGETQSNSMWTIHKFTYVNQQVTLKQTAVGSWSERANLTYE